MPEKIIQIVQELAANLMIPAAAGLVVNRQGVLAQAAIGQRRIDQDAHITTSDLFPLGSCTKAMTATVCAILVDDGYLRWDMTLKEVFVKLIGRMHPQYEDVTLEMLLRHSAGLPSYTDDEAEDFVTPDWQKLPEAMPITHFSEWLLQKTKPIEEPGTSISYSNIGFCIAAAMAEIIMDKCWQSLIQRYLFAPLEIHPRLSGWKHDLDQLSGHQLKDGVVTPYMLDPWLFDPCFLPTGGIFISLSDYARFLQINLDALHGQKTTWPKAALCYLHNQSIEGVGLGWGVQHLASLEDRGLFSVHAGSDGTHYTIVGISHTIDFAVALLTTIEADKPVTNAFFDVIRYYTDNRNVA